MRQALLALGIIVVAASLSSGQDTSSTPTSDGQFSFMKWLADHNLHDIEHERWNAYGQLTYISSWKPRFPARYTNLNGSPNSLLPDPERSFTGTATLYLGLRGWKGAEAYLVPEVIAERGFSQLKG